MPETHNESIIFELYEKGTAALFKNAYIKEESKAAMIKLKLLGSLIIAICFSFTAIGQRIHTTPLDAYWKIIEPLKQNDSLSVKEWYTFLAIDANKTYIENQGFDSAYLEKLRKNIQYVYMPAYDSLLKARVAAIEKDPASYWITYKVYVYKKYEKELKQYQKQLASPAYLEAVYTNAFAWLPKNLQQKDTTVNFYLLGIENDAIAGGGTIIVTLWSAYNQDKIKLGILGGHEMHHVLRKGIEFKNVGENDKGLLYVLKSILNEGTADMIDKVLAIAHEDELPMGSKFKEFELFEADSIVKQIDSSIQILSKTESKVYKTEKDYRNLLRWSSGHCPGYYMADIIVRNGFKKQLISHIQNPFYFIYLYNRAAKKDIKKPPVFSSAAIKYVKLLEEKYLQKNS